MLGHVEKCGSTCLNRQASFQCGPWNCRASGCTNRIFQTDANTLFPFLRVFRTERTGLGLLATVCIPAKTFVVEYVGEYMRVSEYKKERGKEEDTYFLYTADGFGIDARHYGNLSRFVNHSHNPNLVADRWVVDGVTRVALVSRRAISAQEELTFNYGTFGKSASDSAAAGCACNACIEGSE